MCKKKKSLKNQKIKKALSTEGGTIIELFEKRY